VRKWKRKDKEEKRIYKKRLNIYSKEKNIRELEFKVNGYYNYCGRKKGLYIAELDVLRIK